MDKTLSWEEILKTASDNGFDWWGREYTKFGEISKNRIFFWFTRVRKYRNREDNCYSKMFSFADLFTNRSFLEAMAKASPRKDGLIATTWRSLQINLIYDLTNDGNRAREIITEFLG